MVDRRYNTDPFEPNVSTEARTARAIEAPRENYAGFWSFLDDTVRNVSSLVRSSKEDKGTQDKALVQDLGNVWAEQDALLQQEMETLSLEDRKILEREAQIQGQTVGTYIINARANRVRTEMIQRGAPAWAVAAAEKTYYRTQGTVDLASAWNKQQQQEIDNQRARENIIIDAMLKDNLAILNPDGSPDIDATLYKAGTIQRALAEKEGNTNYYNIVGSSRELYTRANQEQKDAINNKIVAHILNNESYTQIEPWQKRYETAYRNNDIQAMNEALGNISLWANEFGLFIERADIPEESKKRLRTIKNNLQETYGSVNVQDYTQAKAVDNKIAFDLAILKSEMMDDPRAAGQLYRSRLLYGDAAAQAFPALAGEINESFKTDPTLLGPPQSRKLQQRYQAINDGIAPQGDSDVARKENYAAIKRTELGIINGTLNLAESTGLIKGEGSPAKTKRYSQYDDSTKGILAGTQKAIGSMYKLAKNGEIKDPETLGLIFGDIQENWTNPTYVEYMSSVKPTAETSSYIEDSKFLLGTSLGVTEVNYLGGNNSKYDLINYDPKLKAFVEGSYSFSEAEGFWDSVTHFDRSLKRDNIIRGLNTKLEALCNLEKVSKGLPSVDKNKVAEDLIEILKSLGTSPIKILGSE